MIHEISKLSVKPNKVLNVVDLDDTIFSRFNWLQDPLLNENRGEAWNKIIEDILWWYEKYWEKNYSSSWVVLEMIELVKTTNSLILTAWKEDFQKIKLNNIWYSLDNENRLVVNRDYKKPAFLLLYIMSSLWYIPGKINVYDDRVKYFNEQAPFLSKLLQTDININEVNLSTQNTNQIEWISQSSYLQLDTNKKRV